jgi:pilus assembly protein Flp/PilA
MEREGTTSTMTRLVARLHTRFVTRERGATAVEYGLLVALIAAVVVAIVLVLGRQVSNAFQSVSDAI